MGNSPPAPVAPVAAPVAPVAAAAPAVSTMPTNAKNLAKNNAKTVVQVPAENVTISKGGKRRCLRGGVASVHFDMVPQFQPSEAIMEHATTAMPSANLKGGQRRRTHKRKIHKRKTYRK